MKINDAISLISTSLEIKRIASAYVVDYSRLSVDETKDAIRKVNAQYYDCKNVENSLNEILYNENNNISVIGMIIIKTILLNSDDFMSLHDDTEIEVINYEQEINRQSAQDIISNSTIPTENLKLYKFVLNVAWESNNSLSKDERNLIEKLRERLRISNYESDVIEADIGKFPQLDNQIHIKKEINSVRHYLQKIGLVFSIRDSKGNDYDLIPTEIALTLRKIWGVSIRKYGYGELIKNKHISNKKYLSEILNKGNINHSSSLTLPELQNLVVSSLDAYKLLLGFNSRDGLDTQTLSRWCQELGLMVSGQKKELADRIIEYYDGLRKKPDINSLEDTRSIYFEYFDELASRKLQDLRNQGIITKDIECERHFESATNYIFEKYLKHKPLVLKGTEHPDGILSINDRLIFWDNKSKETSVNLLDHIKQFDRYIKGSEKSVASFLVIAPSFTDNSVKESKKYSMENDTPICLITAKQLKSIAFKWVKDDSFPLQYFKQSGFFDEDIIDY